MNVTRSVIVDLLPLYAAGEASPDSRALVENFLAKDEELQQLVKKLSNLPLPATSGNEPMPNLEAKSMQRTRQMLHLRTVFLAMAILFTGLTFLFGYTDGRFFLTLRDFPEAVAIFSGLAAIGWIGYFDLRRRLGSTEL